MLDFSYLTCFAVEPLISTSSYNSVMPISQHWNNVLPIFAMHQTLFKSPDISEEFRTLQNVIFRLSNWQYQNGRNILKNFLL